MRLLSIFQPRIGAAAAAVAALGMAFTIGTAPLVSQSGRGGTARTLTAADVMAVIGAAASAISDNTIAIAVVDRSGAILGVYSRPQAAANTPDIAVSLARTTAYFSNDQAPLSSRTVRFISGIHFPAAIKNTPNAALYGVENINRGCDLGVERDEIWNPGIFIPRARSLQGTPGGSGGITGLPCNPSDSRGCAIGGPIALPDGRQNFTQGITTGKRDVFDAVDLEEYETTVNPGGISLYRGGKLIGGIGVAGVSADRAEYAALIGAAGTRGSTGISAAIDFPSLLPSPGAVYIDGIRLPFFSSCGTSISCIQAAVETRPSGSSPGSFLQGAMVFPARSGQQAPEGYLIGPCNVPGVPRKALCNSIGGLTRADVERIVNQAIAEANQTRAAVRLPYGQTSTFIIAVTDENGDILAEYRMTDALFDAVDVVPSKARNAFYFSSPEGYRVLKGHAERAGYTWSPDPPGGAWALTSRTISFGGQPLFPPGIDLERERQGRAVDRGPWFDLFLYDTQNVCTEGPEASRGGNRSFVNQNGITWFPGSAPLYKNGRLAGGLGVSGDGVEQNDLITAAGAVGFEPANEIRVDNSLIRESSGEEVRLPYLKYPRNPTQR